MAPPPPPRQLPLRQVLNRIDAFLADFSGHPGTTMVTIPGSDDRIYITLGDIRALRRVVGESS
jgi:hypothetical protein